MSTTVAMHMSDGLVSTPTALLFAALALGALAWCVRRVQDELDDRAVPLAGLVAAFIFAVQMVNFPILPGVSGHLLGGALAAILVGPFTGALCIAIVLVVQSLLFADGGVTALGTNITNIALISVAVGYATAVALYALAAHRRDAVPVPVLGGIAFLAAMIGTVCAALGFVIEYSIGGAAGASLHSVIPYLLGTHIVIGAGEGVITALTVMAVARTRPDLVYLLRTSRTGAAVGA